MSIFHKNADAATAYTYLKRVREDDVKMNTRDLVTSFFDYNHQRD